MDGQLTDLNWCVRGDCEVEFLGFEDEEAKRVFWHSSAHVMGYAMEMYYGGLLTVGPALDEGFFYDMRMPDSDRFVLGGFY